MFKGLNLEIVRLRSSPFWAKCVTICLRKIREGPQGLPFFRRIDVLALLMTNLEMCLCYMTTDNNKGMIFLWICRPARLIQKCLNIWCTSCLVSHVSFVWSLLSAHHRYWYGIHWGLQWRTQEFCLRGGVNKFSWRQRTERTGIWGR